MDKKDLNKNFSIAREAAISAGKFLASCRKTKVISNYGKDIKVSADKDSERIIIDILKNKSDLPILSEEKGLIGDDKKTDLRWIIDPLDGSLNFFREIPISCVSVGLWDKEKPILGVIYDFNRDELFGGITGVGAWLNGKKIVVSKINNLKQAVLVTGFPAQTDFSLKSLENYFKQIQIFKKVRWLGSAALSLAYVACGRADAYFEKDIRFWDIAAGIAILLGAGGKINQKKTPREYSYKLAATNSLINFKEKDLS